VANLLYGLHPDCIFNLVEAINGDSQMEMALPAMLDLIKIPYTGSGSLTLGLCQDKANSKAVLQANGIRTPWFRVFEFYSMCEDFVPRDCIGIYPVIVKPLHEDGSLGINSSSVAKDYAKMQDAIRKVNIEYHQPAIVEEYIDGREFGIGVIDFNGGPIPFPVSEIVFDGYPDGVPKIVSYSAKWDSESIEYKNSVPHCPADIDPQLAKRLQDTGLKVFKLFGCRGYARVDMRMRGKDIYVIECNPNADCSPGSGIFTMLNAAGVPYEEFVKNLIEGALRGK
jgi:D-alanine-D-alanine ligase